MCKSCCQNEFQISNFTFNGCAQKQFYKMQWTDNFAVYLVYRLLASVFSLSWLIAHYVVWPYPDELYKLTNISELILNIYFSSAFIMTLAGIRCTKDGVMLHKLENEDLKWHHKLVWVLFNINAVAACYVTVGYWILTEQNWQEKLHPLNFYAHNVNIILTLLDLFLVSFPLRILHVVYSMLYSFSYILFTLIMHWSNTNSAIYTVLDWKTGPGLAVGIAAGLIILLPIVIQSFLFGLYKIRVLLTNYFIVPSVTGLQSEPESSISTTGRINYVFDHGSESV